MFLEKLLALKLKKNNFYIMRYLKFIESRTSLVGHKHHILPKAKDFFPEFRNLKEHNWNLKILTTREHFIAHKLLNLAFPGSSQTLAFYHMSNELNMKKSKLYEDALSIHNEMLRVMTKDENRNLKISNALKGKPKSEKHREKLRGIHDEERRQKVSIGMKNSDKVKWSDDAERVKKHSLRMKQRSYIMNEDVKDKISKTKLENKKIFSIEERLNMSKSRVGKLWFNDGEICIRAYEAPSSNWKPGRIIKKRRTKQELLDD